jgi:hypothetical protein
VPKRLSKNEETAKIELKLPVSLKRAAVEAAAIDGDGDVSGWVRSLIRREVKRLGVADAPPAKAEKRSKA